MQTLVVKMGEVQASREDATLETFGVGSCVAIVLYDPQTKIGGMAHVMLTQERASDMQKTAHPLRFVEQAIPFLIKAVERLGAERSRLVAHVVGGAQMFQSYRDPSNAIGPKNTETTLQILREAGIPVRTKETGGTKGRNVHFDLATGTVNVNSKA